MMIDEPEDIRDRLEKRQAILRIIVLSIIFIYVTLFKSHNQNSKELLLLTGAFVIFSFIWYGIVHAGWLNRKYRRYFIIIVDAGMNSFGIFIAGVDGVIFYPMYLFVTIGHGMRFGSKNLIVSIVFSSMGFSLVVLLHPYWSQHITVAVPLLAGLIVLPLYYLKLINNLNIANRQLKQELIDTQSIAKYDKLTSLPNRYYLNSYLENFIQINRDSTLALLFIDLDGFKYINDKYGHDIGDSVLIEFSEVLKSLTRESDLAARLGGDEFIILLRGVKGKQVIENICTRILFALRNIGGQCKSPLSASIGISMYPDDGNTPQELIKHADMAMYKIKNEQKNGYIFYQAV